MATKKVTIVRAGAGSGQDLASELSSMLGSTRGLFGNPDSNSGEDSDQDEDYGEDSDSDLDSPRIEVCLYSVPDPIKDKLVKFLASTKIPACVTVKSKVELNQGSTPGPSPDSSSDSDSETDSEN